MQLIDLSDVHDFSAARFLLYWLIASVVAIIVAYSIGQENKLKWFRQRKSNGFMVRRGVFGNFSLLGVPNSKQGFAITAGIFIGSGVIWALLVFVILPVFGYNFKSKSFTVSYSVSCVWHRGRKSILIEGPGIEKCQVFFLGIYAWQVINQDGQRQSIS